MRTLRYLLRKEFRQIFRNPAILRMIFIMPVIQLIILPLAADYEVKNIQLILVDYDHSSLSRQMVEKILSSGYFKLTGSFSSREVATKFMEQKDADILLEIPARFEQNLVRENKAVVSLSVNAINGVKAGLGTGYVQQIIRDYNTAIVLDRIPLTSIPYQPQIEVRSSFWYNVMMNYQVFMVPGILVLLLTMVAAFLTAINIVREKEIGTIEQINVSPIKKYQFILGKMIPFWILGLVVLTLGLLIARVIYGIVPVGSLLTIYAFAAVYLLAILGLGLLVSTISDNQQQSMLISFFIMMIFILMGGLYTAIESMPYWAQIVTRFNPVSYFIEVMRRVVMKGSSLRDVSGHLFIIFLFAVVLNSWAILNYRKRA
jgi:ABC-2 type transport system permease protein